LKNITTNGSWETFDQFRQTNAEFPIFGYKFREFFPSMRSPYGSFYLKESGKEERQYIELTSEIAPDMHVTVLALIGRRLITTTGGYMGLAPEEVLKDDVIAILYGCNFPVVLRPCGDCYYVIGECYVDGVMNGELIQAKDRGKYQEVEITLC
jgi:hypothetical protein